MLIASHHGSFHADDVFGVSVLQALWPLADIVRTRDPAVIAQADFAVDVGDVYDPDKGRFDHHQKSFTLARPDGAKYASAGLVWDRYGVDYVKMVLNAQSAYSVSISTELAKDIAQRVDEQLVRFLDLVDNGQATPAPELFGLSALLWVMNPTGVVRQGAATAQDLKVQADEAMNQFREAMVLCQTLVRRAVLHAAFELQCRSLVRSAEVVEDGRILVLEHAGLSWYDVVCAEMPDVWFVVYPDSAGDSHQLKVVPVEPTSFKARQDLPAAWAGLRDAGLAAVTGVQDAIFCHTGRFIGGARSKAGALTLARQAVQAVRTAQAADGQGQ